MRCNRPFDATEEADDDDSDESTEAGCKSLELQSVYIDGLLGVWKPPSIYMELGKNMMFVRRRP